MFLDDAIIDPDAGYLADSSDYDHEEEFERNRSLHRCSQATLSEGDEQGGVGQSDNGCSRATLSRGSERIGAGFADVPGCSRATLINTREEEVKVHRDGLGGARTTLKTHSGGWVCDGLGVQTDQMEMNGSTEVESMLWAIWIWTLSYYLLSLLNLISWYQRLFRVCAIGNWAVSGAALDGGAWAARYDMNFQSNDLASDGIIVVDTEVGESSSSGSIDDSDSQCDKIHDDKSPTECD